MAPIVALGIIASMLLASRLDILALGDDTAAVLGVPVRRTRVWITLTTVLLSAAAVTVAGPVGFVGLVAPVLVRLVAAKVPGLDAASRAAAVVRAGRRRGRARGRRRTAGAARRPGRCRDSDRDHDDAGRCDRAGVAGQAVPGFRADAAGGRCGIGGLRSTRTFWIVVGVLVVLVAGTFVFAMLAGDAFLRTGDIANWINGRSGRAITYVLDTRFPRVVSALLCGAALAIAGATVQAVCRNPLAEPGILGITGGAGLGAVLVLMLVPSAGIWLLSGVAAGAALLTFAVVYLISWRGGLSSDRLVLIGVGVSSATTALITFCIVYSNPWNISMAMTWLSGSTYGRTLPQVVPVAIALVVLTPVIVAGRRELDLLALDDDVPRILGVRLERFRLIALVCAALLTAAAVSAIGVVGFVGLVAPHAARALVGGRHSRLIPVAALLGAVLVSIADSLGRTLLAPAQIPAGLLTALIGAPYFVYLLWRTRNPVSS